jgi:chromosome segregation ATPase
MTAEEQLASKLELIKDSIVGFKFAIEAMEKRADKFERELAECRSKVVDLSDSDIRSSAQLAVIEASMSRVASDLRSVRNSVLGAILTAVIIWVGGTAFSTVYRSPVPQTQSAGK